MNKFFLLIFSFFIIGACNKSLSIETHKVELYEIYFDVVEKYLEVEETIPDNIKNLSQFWFDNKLKINGIDGTIKFSIYEYEEEISKINNGKRVDASLKFNALITHESISKKKLINGEVNSFGILEGDFSLDEFDQVIENVQEDLIIRLSRDLKNKI